MEPLPARRFRFGIEGFTAARTSRTGKAKPDDSGPTAPAPAGSASADARGVEELESSPATLGTILLAVRRAERGTEMIPYEGIML